MSIAAGEVLLFRLFCGAMIVVNAWHLRNVELSANGMPKLQGVELGG